MFLHTLIFVMSFHMETFARDFIDRWKYLKPKPPKFYARVTLYKFLK